MQAFILELWHGNMVNGKLPVCIKVYRKRFEESPGGGIERRLKSETIEQPVGRQGPYSAQSEGTANLKEPKIKPPNPKTVICPKFYKKEQ